jgi:hypothetical protein
MTLLIKALFICSIPKIGIYFNAIASDQKIISKIGTYFNANASDQKIISKIGIYFATFLTMTT